MNGRGRPVCLPDRWRRQPSSARAIGASREGPPRGHLRPYAAQSATDCRAPAAEAAEAAAQAARKADEEAQEARRVEQARHEAAAAEREEALLAIRRAGRKKKRKGH